MSIFRPIWGALAATATYPQSFTDLLVKFQDEGTFTRASNATMWTGGVLTTVGNDVARFDRDPITDVYKGLLIEEARTNIALYSGDLDNLAFWWIAGGISMVDGATAPDGTTNATTLTITSSGHIHGLNTPTISVTENSSYTYSFYAQKGTVSSDIRYSVQDKSAGNDIIAPTDYFSQLDGTNWTRIEIPFTTPAGCTSISVSCLRDGTGLGTMNIWGTQVETGSFMSSYIPTTTASATRAKEIPTLTLGDWFNPVEGTIFVDLNPIGRVSQWKRGYSFRDTSDNDYLRTTVNDAYFGINMVDDTITQAGGDIANTGSAKIVVGYKLNDYASSQNGSTVLTDSTCTIPTMTRVDIGHEGTFNQLNGYVTHLHYHPTRKTNSEIESLAT